jgi:hypothetical protein
MSEAADDGYARLRQLPIDWQDPPASSGSHPSSCGKLPTFSSESESSPDSTDRPPGHPRRRLRQSHSCSSPRRIQLRPGRQKSNRTQTAWPLPSGPQWPWLLCLEEVVLETIVWSIKGALVIETYYWQGQLVVGVLAM